MIVEYFSTIADAAFWFQLLCVAIFTVTALDHEGKKQMEWRRFCGRLFFCMAVFFAINLLFYMFSKITAWFAGIGFWFAYLGGIAAFAIVFCKYDVHAKILLASAVFSITIVVCELGSTLGMILEHYMEGFDSLHTKLAADLLLLFAAWVFKKRPVPRYEVSLYAARLNLVCGAASSLVVIVYDLFLIHVLRRGDASFTHYVTLMFIVLLFLYMINFLTYLMTCSLSKEHARVLELVTESQISKSAAQMLDVSENNLNELRKIRHDINNQYSYMNVMLQNEDYESLKSYFEEMVGSFAKPLVPIVDCGNRVLNVIMHMEQAKADKAHVALDLKIMVPDSLPFSEVDLCKLLTNVMDNAIEACVAEGEEDEGDERDGAKEEAVVSVSLGLQGDYFYGCVTNPTKKSSSFFDKPVVTQKKDAPAHGKGMQIVWQVVKKYNGRYQNKIENHEFQVTFLLDMKEGS